MDFAIFYYDQMKKTASEPALLPPNSNNVKVKINMLLVMEEAKQDVSLSNAYPALLSPLSCGGEVLSSTSNFIRGLARMWNLAVFVPRGYRMPA
ncbi:hypothetical protein TNCV_4470581 [Trichonephila clavipes]|uniref:Uncharacterized protein n=1 Tax=Trichonephila clavipes TaxID=2585209 RepID=A0A8X6SBU2_TRICX|nr:hypothetical protein TNCV_4470581 [Trichonephila clavipes]